jgi:dUTP pyrophosphatase
MSVLDNNQIEELKSLFEKLKEEAGYEPTENYSEIVDNITDEEWDEMEKQLYDSMQMKVVKVKKLNDDAVMPSYNYPSDSGFDLHSTESVEIPSLGRVLVPTGLSFDIPDGYEIQVRPKSGLAINQGLTVLNTPGTADCGYTGEIKVIVFNTNNYSVLIPKGMKIAQAVLCPVVNGGWVNLNEIHNTINKDRNENGFGSTGI